MSLSPDKWSKLKELIASALEMPAADRIPFLRSLLADDPALLQEGLSLLEHSVDSKPSAPLLLKGRYRVISNLGQGGFAVVYKALDQTLHGRPVVIKMLTGAITDQYIYRKFEDEIRMLSLLEHPNIVIPLDCGRIEGDQPFLVMQFIEGRTLRQMMGEGLVQPHAVATIIRQLGSAISYAHQNGVIHRDIKPENVIVQTMADGSVHARLIDFGISSLSSARNPQATAIVGSVSYMAPEQFRGEVSFKTDIYGFGALVFEILTGTTPYGAGDPLQILERQKQEYLSAAQTNIGLKPKFRQLLSQSLAYDAAARPANILAFANDLAGQLEAPQERKSRNKISFILLGLVAAAAVIIVALKFLVPSSVPDSPKTLAPAPAPRAVASPAAPIAVPSLAIDFERQTDGPPLSIDADGILHMAQEDSFRMAVRSSERCHLYVFARSLEDTSFHILFPSPTANQGSSSLDDRDGIRIPSKPNWFHFGAMPGTDTVIFVRSKSIDPLLEQGEKYTNAKAKGLLPSGATTARIQELLALPNALQQNGSRFTLVGSGTSCGRFNIRHQ